MGLSVSKKKTLFREVLVGIALTLMISLRSTDRS